MYELWLKHGTEIVRRYIVKKKKISIGSEAGNDIFLDHKMVSAKHCEITQINRDEYLITDFKSAFGVYINNKRILTPTRIFFS